MPVILLPRPERETVGVALHVRAGWRFERPDQRGAAHFLEHLVLRGSARFPGRKAIDALERSPRGFFAGTNREFGLFEANLPAPRAVRGVRALLDSVFRPLLRTDDVAAELPVILDEIEWRTRDTARSLLDTLFSELAGAPMSSRAESSNVALLRQSDLHAYHRQLFRPQRAVLALAGAFDASEILDTVAESVDDGDSLPEDQRGSGQRRPRPSIVRTGEGERTWLLIAQVSQDVDWRAHVAGRAVVQEANASGRGSVTRALRDSALHLYSWECAYYSLGPLGVAAVFIEVPPELSAQAAAAASAALDEAFGINGRALWRVAHEQHLLAFDPNERAARFLAERAGSSPDPLATRSSPARPAEIETGLAQLRAGARTVVTHTAAPGASRLRDDVPA